MTPVLPVKTLLILSFLVLFLLLPSGKAFPEEPLSPEQYRLRVEESLETLRAVKGVLDEDAAEDLRRVFPTGLRIRGPEGGIIWVDREDLLRSIREAMDAPERRESLISYLEALRREIPGEGNPASMDRERWTASRLPLEEVYRLKEFRSLEKAKIPPWREFLGRVLKRIGEWLEGYRGLLGGFDGSWVENVLLGFLVLTGIVLIVWIIRRIGPLGWRRRERRGPSVPGPDLTLEKGWSRWQEEARERAGEGAFRDAIRFIFVSALLKGHEQGWWIYEPEATNREHLGRVEGPTERRDALGRLIELYERSWYGMGNPDIDTFRECERCLGRMEAVS